MKPLPPGLEAKVEKAIAHFWETRRSQKDKRAGNISSEQENRSAVRGGKQLDGFVELLRFIAVEVGIPEAWIHTRGTTLPGYFRATKDWDFLIIGPDNQLLVVIELKSQVGSFGNNFNNRTEEALGSAMDLWTAYREKAFPNLSEPWVGYIMIAEKSEGSTTPVQIQEPFFRAFDEFQNGTYLERYKILCEKLVLERHYSAAALIWTSSDGSFGSVEPRIAIDNFIQAYITCLRGKKATYE